MDVSGNGTVAERSPYLQIPRKVEWRPEIRMQMGVLKGRGTKVQEAYGDNVKN